MVAKLTTMIWSRPHSLICIRENSYRWRARVHGAPPAIGQQFQTCAARRRSISLVAIDSTSAKSFEALALSARFHLLRMRALTAMSLPAFSRPFSASHSATSAKSQSGYWPLMC